MRRYLVVLFATLPLVLGCEDDEPVQEPIPATPAPIVWPSPVGFELSGFAARQVSTLGRISGWVTHVEGPIDARPDVGHRGAFGTGNGYVFGLVGVANPLNTLHDLVGPTYEKGERFFGDYAIGLADAGQAVTDFDEEWAAWSLSVPAILTRARRGELWLDTVDFAPATQAPELRGCLIRVVSVRNSGGTPSGALELVVSSANKVSPSSEGVMLEATGKRTLTTGAPGHDAVVDGRKLRIELGSLAPAGEVEVVVLHCTAEGEDAVALPPVDPAQELATAADAYGAWASRLVLVELPDPMVADFIDGMKMTLHVQTSAGGASCPMSQYTRTWARDNIGPALAFLDLGGHEDVRAMMDYVYGAVLEAGDLRNSYAADLELDALPAAPDWASMPPLEERVAAETPSYMVWIYGAHFRHTGDLAPADERFGFLRRCMVAQGFGTEWLLPFSGDETFRAAMNAAFGLSLEYPHQTKSWSANSSLLWLGAARHYHRLARAAGREQEADEVEQIRQQVERAFLETFVLSDGCVSPVQDRASLEVWDAPFEDVALKVTWAGWRDGDDPFARDALACAVRRLAIAPGRLQSPKDPDLAANFLLPDVSGIYTGMLPGYALAAYTHAGHVDAAAAVNALGESISTSGNLQEYLIADDTSGLSLIYDPGGMLGDYTAKFRPWEGGIDVSALLGYLIGFEPDRPARTLRLRPHLPAGWPSMTFRGLRAGDDRFDVTVSRQGEGHRVVVQSRGLDTYSLVVRWDAPGAATLGVTVEGEPVQSERMIRRSHFGLESVEVGPIELPPGEQRSIGM